ncbi:MAG TPA: hypothetical protein VHK67_06920, partial [Rhabdochlamydiaceae bacterium]|nr:hypothetical protein [Rhabdochlamydiaceae bacterium]
MSIYGETQIILGQSKWQDLLTCFGLAGYALIPKRSIQFIQWNNGNPRLLDHDEAWKVSYVARLILIITKMTSPFNLWVKISPWAVTSIGMSVSIIWNNKAIKYKGFTADFVSIVPVALWVCSIVVALVQQESVLPTLAPYPSPWAKNPDDRKKETHALIQKTSIEVPSTPIYTMPSELVMKVLSLVDDVQTVNNFSLTCKWATKLCLRKEFQPILHLPSKPEALFEILKQPLLDQLKFTRCTSRLFQIALNSPVSYNNSSVFPGKLFLETEFREKIPLWLPTYESEYPDVPGWS